MSIEDLMGRRGFVLPRQREAAGVHFRRLEDRNLARDQAPLLSIAFEPASEPSTPEPCRFEIYRADEVRLTSTRFSGGDWHWRLSDAAGKSLVDAGGYHTEDECRKAVLVLRSEAAFATMRARA